MTKKDIEQAIRLTYDSLQSHLPYIYAGKERNFHRKCVKEYAFILRVLCDMI